MKLRKGNKDHLDMIKSKNPAIIRDNKAGAVFYIGDCYEKPKSKIEDWFNRKPIKWSTRSMLDHPSYLADLKGPFICLNVDCGLLSYRHYFYMQDFKTHNELKERIKGGIATVQPVFNDYSLGKESLKSAEERLGIIKYGSRDKKKIESKETYDEPSGSTVALLSILGLVAFCLAIYSIVSVGG
jgi:hypothetical protein